MTLHDEMLMKANVYFLSVVEIQYSKSS